MSYDISIRAAKDRALDHTNGYNPAGAPEVPIRNAGRCLLSDTQTDILGGFVLKFISGNKRRDEFRYAVMMKLGDGRPADGAFRQALILTAREYGIADERLLKVGLLIGNERRRLHGGLEG